MNDPRQKKLSILICHLPQRADLLNRLLSTMNTPRDASVETLIDANPTDLVGTKRNRLLEKVRGEYVAFVDDDDILDLNYFKLVFEGIKKGVDCCSLLGEITEDGKNPLIFEHSIKYKEYKTNTPDKPIRYERYPNHLNCIKASIAKQFKFPEKNHGEDTSWAEQIHRSGLIKTEHYIPEVIYYYDWRRK